MSESTKIEWADSTFNPWTGCTKVSPACDHCYAEGWAKRSGHVQWGPHAERRRTSEANWRQPLKWNAQADEFYAKHGRRQRVFCASLADVFDNQVPIEWLRDLCTLIELTPNLKWQLLTKRVGNVFERLIEARSHDWLAGQRHVRLGITVCNQEEVDRDVPKLLRTPARGWFLSIEPLLGPILLRRFMGQGFGPAPEWVIVGGESGHGARPMHPDWVRSLRNQCTAVAVPFFFKQWGEWAEIEAGDPVALHDAADADSMGFNRERDCVVTLAGQVFAHPDELPEDLSGRWMERIGKKAAGRVLDGVEWNEVPRWW
jgi:protein gp37